MQDVGARFYTYISTMGYAMQAAAEAGHPVRTSSTGPTPSATAPRGSSSRTRTESFVGLYPVPITHGLTVGELARMIAGERWLARGSRAWTCASSRWRGTAAGCRGRRPGLRVGPAVAQRARRRDGAGLPRHGPFRGDDGERGPRNPRPVHHRRRALGQTPTPWPPTSRPPASTGVRFSAGRRSCPVDLPGQATNPKWEGEAVRGVAPRGHRRRQAFRPVEVGVRVVAAVYRQAPRGAHRDVLQGRLARQPGRDAHACAGCSRTAGRRRRSSRRGTAEADGVCRGRRGVPGLRVAVLEDENRSDVTEME